MKHFNHPWFARLLVTLLLTSIVAGGVLPAAAASAQQEREECARNLQVISQAILKYRKDKKDVPVWLSDLVPDYLDDPNVMVCPVTRRTGEVKNQNYSDPRISTSYVYEFNDQPAGPGLGSNRQWKRLQMSVVGSIVPIVRCWHHEPVLNLSFDGKFFESNLVWEDQLKDLVDPAELTAQRLFSRFNPLEGYGPLKPLDLTRFYNCQLTQPMHNDPKGNGPSLKNFPGGTNVFGGITFNTQGVIQLYGTSLQNQQPGRYTNVVTGIPVGQKVRRLHFLGGCGWSITEKQAIGEIIVHYENRSQDRVPIVYERHVKDWWQEAPRQVGVDQPIVAWGGDIEKDMGGTGPGHVYRYSWTNPQPNLSVVSLDFRSFVLNPAPFLLAVTAESN